MKKKENKKLYKVIATIDNQNPVASQKNYYLFEIRQKLKETKKNLADKNKENEQLRKHIKFTKIQELQTEIQCYLDENYKLKSLLSNPISQNDNKTTPNQEDYNNKENHFLLQHKLITELKETIKKQHYLIEKKDEENVKLQVENENNEKKAQRYTEEIKNLRKSQAKLNEEMRVLKEENIFFSSQIAQLLAAAQARKPEEKEKNIEFLTESVVLEKEDNKNLEKSLRNVLAQKEQIINYQEKTIIDLRLKLEVLLYVFNKLYNKTKKKRRTVKKSISKGKCLKKN